MYKKAMSCLAMVYLILLCSTFCIKQADKNQENAGQPAISIRLDETVLANEKTRTMGIANMAASGQRIVEYDSLERESIYSKASAAGFYIDEQDLEVLCRIVEAEAGGEDETGKLLVANVVLNRVKSEDFPDTVTEVVFQQEKGVSQFSPVGNGRIWSVDISEETYHAVERALGGEDVSQGALYFAARKYADSDRIKWFDENLTFLFEHGGHEFFVN